VLYAPTFRRGANPGYADVISRFSSERFALMVKPHPLETARIEGRNVADVGDSDVLDVLPLCDAMITDYSAVAFEALVLGVPVYYYVHDIDAYREENGLNVDPLVEVPEVASRDIDEIARWIESDRIETGAARRARDRYLPADLGGSTERIADVIAGHLQENARR
jgi:CDP-ribitol ribitolphosphotransferase